jgi:hemerythrin superfamily protein
MIPNLRVVAAKPGYRRPNSTVEVSMPDVIKLLEADHREVEELFAKAESISGAAKQQVVSKICTELTIHAEVEEAHVYPAMESAGLTSEVSEAESEHQQLKDLVAQIEAMDGSIEIEDTPGGGATTVVVLRSAA